MCRFLVLAFSFLILSNVAFAQESKRIHIVTEHYPPYEMEQAIEGLRGFDYEVAREAFKRMGYTPKIEFLPWKRALEMTRTGQVAGVLTCAYTKERAEFMIFSDPLSSFTNAFVVRKEFEGPKPQKIDDVKGFTTGSVKAYESLRALKDAGLNPIEASSSDTALAMLLAKRFDYLYASLERTSFDLKRLKLVGQLEFHPIIKKDFYFCFSKKFPGVETLVEKFNSVLTKMRTEGSLQRIHAKYQ